MRKAVICTFALSVVVVVLGALVSTNPVVEAYPSGMRLPFVGRANYYTHDGHLEFTSHARDVTPKSPSAWNGDVIAMASGKVIMAKARTDVAQYCPDLYKVPQKEVRIEHNIGGTRYMTVYAHLSSFSVSDGQQVSKGQKIGVWGNTGCADGKHLHFEVHKNGSWGNPFSGSNINVDDLPGVSCPSSCKSGAQVGEAIGPSLTSPTPTPKQCVGTGVRLDFSCDGVADLAAMYDYGGGNMKIWFFYNNGPGTLSHHTAYTSCNGCWWAEKTRLVAGDFSGDGVDELAAMYDYGGNNMKIWFFYNNGPGTLSHHTAYTSCSGCWSAEKTKLVAGDFSGDGTDDLAAMYDYGNGLTKIWFFYNNGPGTLTPYLAWTSSPGGWSWANTKLVAGDFNSDGVDDLAAMYDYGGDNMKIWFFYTDKKTRTASHHLAYTSCDGCWSWEKTKLVAGDFSGDGTDDLAAMYDYGGGNMKIWFFYNNGPGTLSHHKAYTSCSGCWSWEKTKLVAGDFSGDGVDELAAMYDYGGENMKIWFFYNNGPGTLSHHTAYTSCNGCWSWSDTMLAGEASADPPPPPALTPTPTPALVSPSPTNTSGSSPAPTPTLTPTPFPTPAGTVGGATFTPTPTMTLPPGATPSPTPTPTPLPTAVPEPTKADGDCDGDVDAVDVLKTLQYVAALTYSQNLGCPTFGSWLPAVAGLEGSGFVFGDIDCDDDVDAVDALWVLRYIANMPLNLLEGCSALGE